MNAFASPVGGSKGDSEQGQPLGIIFHNVKELPWLGLTRWSFEGKLERHWIIELFVSYLKFQNLITLCNMQTVKEVPKPTQIFLPLLKTCHSKPLIICHPKCLGSCGKLFTTNGGRESKVFFRTCQTCDNEYYLHYKIVKDADIKFMKLYKPDQFFSSTKSSIFGVGLLCFCTQIVAHGSCEFISLTLSYCETFVKNIKDELSHVSHSS